MPTTAEPSKAQQGQLNIDIKKHFDDIRDMYASSASRNTINALIFGDYGTGKTWGLRYARGPVLIHSFDPGGAKNLRDAVEEGKVLVDSRFEEEDPSSPSAFREWEKEFRRLEKEGIFNHIGTYVIDSLTTFGDALMNEILKANGRAPSSRGVNLNHRRGQTVAIPELRDYQIQMVTLAQELGICCSLPCDFIATAHLDYDKDEHTGKVLALPMLTGKLKQRVPALFDEVYIAQSVSKASGNNEFRYLTTTDGMFRGRTRLPKIEKYEDQNISKMLKKAGYSWEEHPYFN